MINKISCDYQVTEIPNLRKVKEILNLMPDETYTLKIDYPLEKPTYRFIKTGKVMMELWAILNKIEKFYREIYEDPEKYHVYGHDITDLVVESVTVNHVKRTISIGVGS